MDDATNNNSGVEKICNDSKSDCHGSNTNDLDKSISYTLLDELNDKHKDLILSIYKAGATATHDGSAHIMLHITLKCENSYVNNVNNAKSNTKANMYNCV